MKKRKVAHLPQPQTKTLLADDPEQDLARAYDVTWCALGIVQQLQSLSHTISEIGPTHGNELTIEARDVVHTMGLFSQNLEKVHDLIDEVRALLQRSVPLEDAVNQ